MTDNLRTQSGIDGEVTVDFDGNVAIVTMNRGENRFNPSFIDAMQTALDKVESNPNVQVMVTTGKGKFYSNGLDLNFLTYKGEGPDREDFGEEFRIRLFRLMTRLVELPLVTVAAMNGHAYAAGALLALAHDYRVMNNEKGWFCLNEVHIGRNFNPYLQDLIRFRLLTGRVFLEATVMGRRYTGPEALADKIVEKLSSPTEVVDTAIRQGRSILPKNGFNRKYLLNMKKNILGSRLRALKNEAGLVKSVL